MSLCLSCGACCASFRVSFYWAEADPFTGGSVPAELTEKISPALVAMKGTNQKNTRCVSLEGDIDGPIRCGIYEQRPSTCREFEEGREAFLRARRKHGLDADLIPVVAA